MTKLVISRKTVLQKINQAMVVPNGWTILRDFVLDYYATDDDYVFQTDTLETIFALLAAYVESVEVYGDDLCQNRLVKLQQALSQEQVTAEQVFIALKYDRLANLTAKLQAGLISKAVFEAQVKKLSSIKIDWGKVMAYCEANLFSLSINELNLNGFNGKTISPLTKVFPLARLPVPQP